MTGDQQALGACRWLRQVDGAAEERRGHVDAMALPAGRGVDRVGRSEYAAP
jgi:hypothetical protein